MISTLPGEYTHRPTPEGLSCQLHQLFGRINISVAGGKQAVAIALMLLHRKTLRSGLKIKKSERMLLQFTRDVLREATSRRDNHIRRMD